MQPRRKYGLLAPAEPAGERQLALNTYGYQGGKGRGGPLTQQHAPTAHSHGLEGDPQTRHCMPLACRQGTEEEGGSPTQQRTQHA